MTFQNVVNSQLTKYYPGDITRENPINILPFFAEDVNCKAGGFVFAGTNAETQVLGLKSGATAIVGVAKRTPYQSNITGGVSNVYHEGSELTVLNKGYIAVLMNNSANYQDNVFVDPITGTIQASASSTQAAVAGKLTFGSVSTVVNDWKAITAGTLDLNVNGTPIALTALDFSAATDMDGVATVLDTAITLVADVAYTAGTGLVITSKTTGATSSVEFVSSTNLTTLLGAGVSVDGINAMIATGFKVNASCGAGAITEIYNI